MDHAQLKHEVAALAEHIEELDSRAAEVALLVDDTARRLAAKAADREAEQ